MAPCTKPPPIIWNCVIWNFYYSNNSLAYVLTIKKSYSVFYWPLFDPPWPVGWRDTWPWLSCWSATSASLSTNHNTDTVQCLTNRMRGHLALAVLVVSFLSLLVSQTAACSCSYQQNGTCGLDNEGDHCWPGKRLKHFCTRYQIPTGIDWITNIWTWLEYFSGTVGHYLLPSKLHVFKALK